jgi:drug/metabolite transporter (DMT)-like permease
VIFSGALAVLAAALNALGDLLQRRSMRADPGPRDQPVGLVAQLVRRPGWLAGLGASVLGLGTHVVALSTGTIVAVQPLLVLEFPLAVVGTSVLFGVRLRRRDWVAVAVMTAGLGGILACLAPRDGDPTTVPGATWAIGLGVLGVLVAVLAAAGALTRGNRRATLLGIAAGVGYGMTATLLSAAGTTARHGLAAPLGTWQLYGALVVGMTSFFLLQSSLNAGLLLATEPGLTLANPLVAVAWGVLVFDEHVRSGPWLVGAAAGALALGVGTVLLSRSPVLEASHCQDHDEEHDQEHDAATARATAQA